MSGLLSFEHVCELKNLVNYVIGAGYTIEEVAPYAKKKPSTLRRWMKEAGYVYSDAAKKWIHV